MASSTRARDDRLPAFQPVPADAGARRPQFRRRRERARLQYSRVPIRRLRSLQAPITITTGGTYSGAWRSASNGTPVIRVHTTQPVIIQNSVLQGRGDLIVSDFDHTDITVLNMRGYALNPNVAGKSAGRFFDSTVFNRAILENNYMQGTSGIVVNDFEGTKTDTNTIKILNNVAMNIDGRKSDGAGGYLNYNTRTSKTTGQTQDGYDDVQFFQMGNCTSLANVQVAWNQVFNEPGNSRVEDNISVYKSNGTSASPIRIHDNYVQGAYTINPRRRTPPTPATPTTGATREAGSCLAMATGPRWRPPAGMCRRITTR